MQHRYMCHFIFKIRVSFMLYPPKKTFNLISGKFTKLKHKKKENTKGNKFSLIKISHTCVSVPVCVLVYMCLFYIFVSYTHNISLITFVSFTL